MKTIFKALLGLSLALGSFAFLSSGNLPAEARTMCCPPRDKCAPKPDKCSPQAKCQPKDKCGECPDGTIETNQWWRF